MPRLPGADCSKISPSFWLTWRPAFLIRSVNSALLGNMSQPRCVCRSLTIYGKNKRRVIPRHAACRGILLLFGFTPREIPHFARNDGETASLSNWLRQNSPKCRGHAFDFGARRRFGHAE